MALRDSGTCSCWQACQSAPPGVRLGCDLLARGPDTLLPFNGTTIMIRQAARPQALPEAEIACK